MSLLSVRSPPPVSSSAIGASGSTALAAVIPCPRCHAVQQNTHGTTRKMHATTDESTVAAVLKKSCEPPLASWAIVATENSTSCYCCHRMIASFRKMAIGKILMEKVLGEISSKRRVLGIDYQR